MKLSIYCRTTELNWATIDQLPNVLAKFGLKFGEAHVSLTHFPATVEVGSLSKAAAYIKSGNAPDKFVVSLEGKSPDRGRFWLSGGVNIHQQRYLVAELTASEPAQPLKAARHDCGASSGPKTLRSAHGTSSHRISRSVLLIG